MRRGAAAEIIYALGSRKIATVSRMGAATRSRWLNIELYLGPFGPPLPFADPLLIIYNPIPGARALKIRLGMLSTPCEHDPETAGVKRLFSRVERVLALSAAAQIVLKRLFSRAKRCLERRHRSETLVFSSKTHRAALALLPDGRRRGPFSSSWTPPK